MVNVGTFYTHWNISWPFVIVYGNLAIFVVNWYISPVLVYCTKKNLATLVITCARHCCEQVKKIAFLEIFNHFLFG
jgi:hypothetical protein